MLNLPKYLNCLSNVERISDHAVNIAELAQELSNKKVRFSEQAARELRICIDAALEISELTQRCVKENNATLAETVEPLEEVIDALTKDLKKRHIQRVQAGNCTLELGFIFNDCINNLGRVADHCSNLAIAVLKEIDTWLQPHDYAIALKQGNSSEYADRFSDAARKYYDALDSLN